MPRKSTKRADGVYPLSAVRTVALHAQGLAAATNSSTPPTADSLYQIIDQIGCVQIDTLHLIQRSQYIVLWSRLGHYDPKLLDLLTYGDRAVPTEKRDRRLFEYWLKAACLIPLTDYRYRMPLMRWYKDGNRHWFKEWFRKPGHAELLQAVYERIQQEGARRSADFVHRRAQPGSWWDWKPAKIALEHHYNSGDLMIGDRVHFQRVYDLRERVLPAWVDTNMPGQEEMIRHLLRRAMKALGICTPVQVGGYFFLKRTEFRPILADLIKSGEFVEVKARLNDGETHTLVMHRDQRPWLDQAADGALVAGRTTFLSPFDNLFWAPGRDDELWGFWQRLEAYTPEPKRRYGYFCLPIVHKDRVVGRFDPKLERKAGVLRLKALYLEPGIAPDDELVAGVADALRDFMRFHHAHSLQVERSQPDEFGAKLLKAL